MADEEAKDNSNCAPDKCATLLEFKSSKLPPEVVPLTETEVTRSVACQLTDPNGLSYLSGYFFKKLMNYHKTSKTNCDNCVQHGEKIEDSTMEMKSSEVFLFLKKHQGATMFRCDDHFNEYVRHIVQIASYCYQQKRDEEGIVQKVVLTVEKYLRDIPVLCSLNRRFIALVARTIITGQVRWTNSDIRAKKKFKCGQKNDPAAKKLQRLTHQ